MRYLRWVVACVMVGAAAAGCTSHRDHKVPLGPSSRPAAITPVVGTWTAMVGTPHPQPWTLLVSADGTFRADELMQLSTGSAVVPVHFTGQVHDLGQRQYRFVFTTQGGEAVATTGNVITMVLSPDGSKLSYTVGGAMVMYHRRA
jgi:hypothetical protein